MSVFNDIDDLVSYAADCELIQEDDRIFAVNQLLEILLIDEYEQSGINVKNSQKINLESVLSNLADYYFEHNPELPHTLVTRDLLSTRLMAVFVDKPSAVIQKFRDKYKKSPELATDYFYALSKNSDYIRTYRIKKDLKWVTKTEYGDIDITINLSKPEKDPRDIAALKNVKSSSYPKCLLCKENVGYAGRLNHPARQNLRIIPLMLGVSKWGMQYSPYVYYQEHCIVFNYEHIPMHIDKTTFERLLEFLRLFPHYTIGSNADLPIVGGSILTHDHFQGGRYEFSMARAPTEYKFKLKKFKQVEIGIVKWPMSVLRLKSKNTARLSECADHILKHWKTYSDAQCFIFAETDGIPHNTITPIARRKGKFFELDLVLRNNITTDEHPLGVFHPHAELHHIKKENIGLIEVLGLAILPARLADELNLVKKAILQNEDINSIEQIKKHAEWVKMIKEKYPVIDDSNIDAIIQDETGLVFKQVLEDAGVYKRTEEGRQGFMRFIRTL